MLFLALLKYLALQEEIDPVRMLSLSQLDHSCPCANLPSSCHHTQAQAAHGCPAVVANGFLLGPAGDSGLTFRVATPLHVIM